MKDYPKFLAYFNAGLPMSSKTVKLLSQLDEPINLAKIEAALNVPFSNEAKALLGNALKDYIRNCIYYQYLQGCCFTNFFRAIIHDMSLAQRKLNTAIMALSLLSLPWVNAKEIRDWLQNVSDLLRVLHFDRTNTTPFAFYAAKGLGNFERTLDLMKSELNFGIWENLHDFTQWYRKSAAKSSNCYLKEVLLDVYELQEGLVM
jgi:hypothetical protein